MSTRRDLLRFASLATAAGWTFSLPKNAYGDERAVNTEDTPNHRFHAETAALRMTRFSPLLPSIPDQASVSLSPNGGYLSQHAPAFRADGIVSFSSAYTHISGVTDKLQGRGWGTFSTSVVEDLNIGDVVTADRVVAQIFTEHPLNGYVPSVSFAGTHFENLRISGRPLDINLDLHMLGEKPADDLSYISEPGFRGRVQAQSDDLASRRNIPAQALNRYIGAPSAVANGEQIEFSLLKSTRSDGTGAATGHVIHVPNIGTVHLATVNLLHEDYQQGTPRSTTITMTMIETQTNDTTIQLPTVKTNGGSGPG